MPESWACIDCGVNTAPRMLNRQEMEEGVALDRTKQGVGLEITDGSEVYTVKDAVWKRAGITQLGGCLCIGCLEKRLGRRLMPKDFDWSDALNTVPGTERLLDRQGR